MLTRRSQFPTVGTSHSRLRTPHAMILAHDKQYIYLFLQQVELVALVGMFSRNARQPVEAKFIFGLRRFPVVSLQQADDVFVQVVPPTGAGAVLVDVVEIGRASCRERV